MKLKLKIYDPDLPPGKPVMQAEMSRGDDDKNLFVAEFLGDDYPTPLRVFVELVEDEIDFQILDVSFWGNRVPAEIQNDIELWLTKGLLKKTGPYTYLHTHDHVCDVYRKDPGDCNCGAGKHIR